MIAKIQRNLTGPSSILVYDEPIESVTDGMITDTHEIFSQIPMPEHQIISILGDDLKGYFEVELGGDAIVIGKRVQDQGW